MARCTAFEAWSVLEHLLYPDHACGIIHRYFLYILQGHAYPYTPLYISPNDYHIAYTYKAHMHGICNDSRDNNIRQGRKRPV